MTMDKPSEQQPLTEKVVGALEDDENYRESEDEDYVGGDGK